MNAPIGVCAWEEGGRGGGSDHCQGGCVCGHVEVRRNQCFGGDGRYFYIYRCFIPAPHFVILPGAVAAASREMRPVEIVGLYEEQREGLEVELGAARQEVRASDGS